MNHCCKLSAAKLRIVTGENAVSCLRLLQESQSFKQRRAGPKNQAAGSAEVVGCLAGELWQAACQHQHSQKSLAASLEVQTQ